jgi:outer membrane protein assembly factor BamB
MKKWHTILLAPFLVTLPISLTAQHIVREFDAPGPESRDLAWDGQHLWCADALKDSIYQIDPASGHVLHTIPFDFSTTSGGGITWGGDGTVWVTRTQYFYKLNASTGQPLTNFHCPGG